MNNANNKFLIGKNSGGTAKSITGEITELSYSCRTFNYDHIDNYKILPSLREGTIKGSYLFDEDEGIFENMISLSKQGYVNRGASFNPDQNYPPLITASGSSYLELGNKRYFLIKTSDYQEQPAHSESIQP